MHHDIKKKVEKPIKIQNDLYKLSGLTILSIDWIQKFIFPQKPKRILLNKKYYAIKKSNYLINIQI